MGPKGGAGEPQGGDGEPQGGARGPQVRQGGLTKALRRGRRASYFLFITVFGDHLTLIHQLKST